MKSANLELIIAYFEKLEREGFYGSVECTMQGGKLAHTREYKSVQDFEIAAESWELLTEEAKAKLKEKFGNNVKFNEALKKHAPILKAPTKLTH